MRVLSACFYDGILDFFLHLSRIDVGSVGSILQALDPFRIVPRQPFISRLATDFEAPTDLGHAPEGRIRIILDNAALHTQATGSKVPLEVPFAAAFQKAAKAPAAIIRGCFARYSHDKIFIVSKSGAPIQVLTGSTNFSVTGLYVNANHVLVFDDHAIASEYAKVFEQSWSILNGARRPKSQRRRDLRRDAVDRQQHAGLQHSLPDPRHTERV